MNNRLNGTAHGTPPPQDQTDLFVKRSLELARLTVMETAHAVLSTLPAGDVRSQRFQAALDMLMLADAVAPVEVTHEREPVGIPLPAPPPPVRQRAPRPSPKVVPLAAFKPISEPVESKFDCDPGLRRPCPASNCPKAKKLLPPGALAKHLISCRYLPPGDREKVPALVKRTKCSFCAKEKETYSRCRDHERECLKNPDPLAEVRRAKRAQRRRKYFANLTKEKRESFRTRRDRRIQKHGQKVACAFCGEGFTANNKARHEERCSLNPANKE